MFEWFANGFDFPILDWIQNHLRCDFFDAIMPPITHLADSGILWIVLAVVLLCIPKHRQLGLSIGAALLLGLVICNLTMKPLFHRIRPYDYLWEHCGISVKLLIETPHDFSFPSGHTIASFEAATVLMLKDRKWGIPALILAIVIAFSRLYLYVHYPTDVLVSILLGIGIGYLGTFLVQKGYEKMRS